MPEGQYTIPTRVYLNEHQRNRLMHMVSNQQVDVPELLTELLISFLDHLPAAEQAAWIADEPVNDLAADLRKRRAELRRLRANVAARGNEAPGWFASYVAQLEREIHRLEEIVAKDTP
jgi:hypothetical protein